MLIDGKSSWLIIEFLGQDACTIFCQYTIPHTIIMKWEIGPDIPRDNNPMSWYPPVAIGIYICLVFAWR